MSWLIEDASKRFAGYEKTFESDPWGTTKRYYMNETLLPGSKDWNFLKEKLGLNGPPTKKQKKEERRERRALKKAGKMYKGMSTACCVDLGTMNLRKHAKGGYYGDRVNEEHLEEFQYFEEYRQNTIVTSPNRKNFVAMFPESISPAGNDAMTFVETNIAKLNSVEQLEAYFLELGLTDPTYDTTTPTLKVTDKNDGDAVMCLLWQELTLKFKNGAKNTVPAGGGDDTISTTPAYCNLYVLQATKDVYRPDGNASTTNDFQIWLNGGWRSRYESDETLGITSQHLPGVNWKDNTFVNDMFKVVDRRNFMLTPGQEGVLHVKLGVPQVLSTKYKLNNIVYDNAAGTYKWTGVVIKKGEFVVIWDQLGGLHPFSEGISPEESKVFVYGIRRYKMGRFNAQESDVRRNAVITVTDGVNYTANDVDIEHQ